MASYKVTLFKNTGLNGVNTVDNVSVLNKATHFTVPDVELMQDRNLGHIDVEATFSQCEDCDYCIVGSECYSIPDGGINAKTEAVTEITLLSDPFLSAGGITVNSSGDVTARFDILDGVTQRCTVKDDGWGKYTTDDPLTAPQEPLQMQTEWLKPSGGGGRFPESISGDPIFIETSIDLPRQYAQQNGKTYSDEETGESVTVPETEQIYINPEDKGNTTDIPPDVWDETTRFSISGSETTDGTAIFIKNDTNVSNNIIVGDAESGTQTNETAGTVVEKGLQAVRSLGIETGSIINQWKIPRAFTAGAELRYGLVYIGTGIDKKCIAQNVYTIYDINGSLKSTISPDYASVKNKRVLYGDYNKYGLITCAGNSAEFKPEDLGGETAPSISYKSDPRPKGKPYYRFTTINGNTDFWRNSLAGSEWENVPLVYQGASGSALTRLNFDNERAIKSLEKQQYNENYLLRQAQNIAGFADSAVSAAAGGMVGSALNQQVGTLTASQKDQFSGAMNQMSTGTGGMLSSLVNIGAAAVQQRQYGQMYAAQKANELSSLYQSTTVYAPTVNFPYNADILRDVKGNGVLVYKYHMSPNDTKRVDKLLTMYGYMSAEPLTLANFGRRKHFDYVACSTISITGLPKWRCDAIAQQLKVGIRIWHELPNTNAYDDNPVRS